MLFTVFKIQNKKIYHVIRKFKIEKYPRKRVYPIIKANRIQRFTKMINYHVLFRRNRETVWFYVSGSIRLGFEDEREVLMEKEKTSQN